MIRAISTKRTEKNGLKFPCKRTGVNLFSHLVDKAGCPVMPALCHKCFGGRASFTFKYRIMRFTMPETQLMVTSGIEIF